MSEPIGSARRLPGGVSRGTATIGVVEYQALYRTYRPQRFAEIVGQDHVTDTLRREIEEGRVAHAYLFAGPRGTGKTTTARILAKALNCPNRGDDGEPCNECPSCVAITDGSSLDVIEMDAASHNSVEDIRDMRVSVSTVASVGGAKRVFILDEAHMLSKAAGNALLKTLEEPPEHVHFVLATTEPYKLLDTIRSRAQRFDFRQVPIEVLVGHLRSIAAAESYTADDQALVTVARRARGSVRDALSLLEQVAALGEGTVDVTGVNRALGLADADAFRTLADAVDRQDAKQGLELVAGLASQGVDLRRFVGEAVGFFRGVFLAHYAPNLAEVADEPDFVLDEWRKTAKALKPQEVLRIVDHLSEALLRLREGREERLMTELAILKLTRPETATDAASLLSRIERLEQQARRNRQATPAAETRPRQTAGKKPSKPATKPQAAARPSETSTQPAVEPPPEAQPTEPVPEPAPVVPPVEDLTLEQVEAVWPAIVAGIRDHLGPRRLAFFREASPIGVDGATIVLGVPAHLGFHLSQLQADPAVAQTVAEKAAEMLGGAVAVRFTGADQQPATEPDTIPDKDHLQDAGDAIDPGALVEGLLGGQVIEEITPD